MVRYPANVTNFFDSFFRKKKTDYSVSFVTCNPNYLIAKMFANNQYVQMHQAVLLPEDNTGPHLFGIPF